MVAEHKCFSKLNPDRKRKVQELLRREKIALFVSNFALVDKMTVKGNIISYKGMLKRRETKKRNNKFNVLNELGSTR